MPVRARLHPVDAGARLSREPGLRHPRLRRDDGEAARARRARRRQRDRAGGELRREPHRGATHRRARRRLRRGPGRPERHVGGEPRRAGVSGRGDGTGRCGRFLQRVHRQQHGRSGVHVHGAAQGRSRRDRRGSRQALGGPGRQVQDLSHARLQSAGRVAGERDGGAAQARARRDRAPHARDELPRDALPFAAVPAPAGSGRQRIRAHGLHAGLHRDRR